MINAQKGFNVYINSQDRIYGDNTDFTINFNNITNIINKPCYVMCRAFESTLNSCYQIQENINSHFTFSVDGVSTLSFEIPSGTYTVTSITAILKTLLELNDGVVNTYTFGYNNDTNKINITPTYASGTFELRCSLMDARVVEILGCGTSDVTIASGSTFVFPNQCNLNPVYQWFICCDSFYNESLSSNTENNFKNAFYRAVSLSRFSRFSGTQTDLDLNIVFCSRWKPSMRFYIIDQNGDKAVMDSNLNTTFMLKVYPVEE